MGYFKYAFDIVLMIISIHKLLGRHYYIAILRPRYIPWIVVRSSSCQFSCLNVNLKKKIPATFCFLFSRTIGKEVCSL